uniref:Uncharacterized protein n=1 Tax=Ditylenchus dipsaci TaxID=166011 RepID=A0A915D7J4_9BILA
MATLDRDLLFEIAGKLVMASGDFSEPTNSLFDNIMNSLDFSRPTDLAAVKFMLVNRACKRAFLSQFSIIKTLTEYYENDDKLWLIALLIHNGKFKPRELLLENFFTEISGLGKYVSEKGGRSAMKCFSNLFGLDKVGLYLDGYHGPKLLLDRLGLRERKKCSVKLDTLLRLDAKEVAILLESEEYSQVKISGFSRVNSTSVQKFKILAYDCWSLEEYGMSNSTTKKWFQLMSYVMSSCPKSEEAYCLHSNKRSD